MVNIATPYLVNLIIQYPSGTALNNVNVTVRLESSNESRTETTNSSGEVAYNLGNTKEFPSGWQVGDVFSWVVIVGCCLYSHSFIKSVSIIYP